MGEVAATMTVRIGGSPRLACVVCGIEMSPGEALEVERRGEVVYCHRPSVPVLNRATGACFKRGTEIPGGRIRLFDRDAAAEYDLARAESRD